MRTHCCGHIVAHDVSSAAQTGKHLLQTQNVSEQNQKHFLCPGHTGKRGNIFCVPDTGKRGNICVGNNVSATMRPRLPGPLDYGACQSELCVVVQLDMEQSGIFLCFRIH